VSRPRQKDSSRERPFQVCESMRSEELPFAPRRLSDWPDDELSRIHGELRRLARRRVDNADDVEDLVQDTFLTMLEKYPQEELRKGLQVWSLGILRNKIGNYYKRARRENSARDLHVRGPNPGTNRWSAALPDTTVRYGDLRILLRRLISDYDPAAKAVMELFFEGLKAAEIGSFMEPQLYQTVVSRLHRGRRTLVRRLTRFGYRPENSQ